MVKKGKFIKNRELSWIFIFTYLLSLSSKHCISVSLPPRRLLLLLLADAEPEGESPEMPGLASSEWLNDCLSLEDFPLESELLLLLDECELSILDGPKPSAVNGIKLFPLFDGLFFLFASIWPGITKSPCIVVDTDDARE